MKTWDIVDDVNVVGEITKQEKNRKPFVAQVSSAVRTVFVGIIVANSSAGAIAQPFASASVGSRIQILRPVSSVSQTAYTRRAADGTDTQFGQSTVKLSRAFEAFFKPADAEDDIEDEYCFG